MGLASLLSDPQAPLRRFDGGLYPFSRTELRDTLMLLWQQLTPGASLPMPGEGMPVEWEDMTSEEWVSYREWLKTV